MYSVTSLRLRRGVITCTAGRGHVYGVTWLHVQRDVVTCTV